MNLGWNVGVICYMDITQLTKDIRYRQLNCLYYRHLKLASSRRLRALNCDVDVLSFFQYVKRCEIFDVYV